MSAEFQLNFPCFLAEEKENGPPHKRQKVDDDLVTFTEHRQSLNHGDDESRITPATSEKFDVSIFHDEVRDSSNA